MNAQNNISNVDNSQDTFLDFEIDKTYAAYFETGNHLGQAFLTYVLLLGLAALLAFGKGINNEVAVPFLGLTLDKTNAGIVILALSFGSLFWFTATIGSHQMLSIKLRWLLYQRYKFFKGSHWNIAYPSVIRVFSITMGESNHLASVLFAIGYLIILFLFPFIPLAITWTLCNSLGLSAIYKILICTGVLALALTNLALLRIVASKKVKELVQDNDKLLKDEEKEDVGLILAEQVDQEGDHKVS